MTEQVDTGLNLLSQIKIVLIETSHPGNIGAVARAMKNMGLTQLVLVNPKEFPSQIASSRASSATDILANALVVSSLDEAVQDCQLVVGASARLRRVSWPQMDVRETAQKLLSTVQVSEQSAVAILFGREDSGLSNIEMDKCHYLAHIPTNEAYSSLNIAAAVQVFVYECRMTALIIQQNKTTETPSESLATMQQLEGFYEHLYITLQQIDFLDPLKNAQFMRRMRRLFNRSELDLKEVDILRGILTAMQRKVKK
jgi:TrmH family RNA methyltransferase